LPPRTHEASPAQVFNSPPSTVAYWCAALFLKPPPTHEWLPSAPFSRPPLIELYSSPPTEPSIVELKCPPLIEDLSALARSEALPPTHDQVPDTSALAARSWTDATGANRTRIDGGAGDERLHRPRVPSRVDRDRRPRAAMTKRLLAGVSLLSANPSEGNREAKTTLGVTMTAKTRQAREEQLNELQREGVRAAPCPVCGAARHEPCRPGPRTHTARARLRGEELEREGAAERGPTERRVPPNPSSRQEGCAHGQGHASHRGSAAV
jgi:hypothetical protein